MLPPVVMSPLRDFGWFCWDVGRGLAPPGYRMSPRWGWLVLRPVGP